MIHIVLYEPEIAQNVGNILRSCAALNAQLHVIHPLGFLLHSKEFKRAMMDYDQLMEMMEHDSLSECLELIQGEVFYITRYGMKTPSEFDFKSIQQDIVIVFGKESSGIPKTILRENLSHCIRIPMHPLARSMNVSNTVAIILYEVQRQLNFEGLSSVEMLKGEDWLLR
jgi:tRNA (cytidine/uridine-2'-O-)-methyltransferase